MPVFLDVPKSCEPVAAALEPGLARVVERFDRQLASDLPPVARLVRHIEKYRGKMLRPMLTLVAGMAAVPRPARTAAEHVALLTDAHIVCAAVCEMIHMATLVHDDVLDEAAIRRQGETVNRLHGNEAAVILGDYLIASAYNLCSQLDQQRTALVVSEVSMTLCAGELLQLSHREDLSLDEPTYFEIIDRKTASLIALAARLGAQMSGADEATVRRLETFGREIGVAFQIQDDLLDLTGRQSTLGKPVGKDLEKGKLTLPMIHHLASVRPEQRGKSLTLLRRAAGDAESSPARELVAAIEASGSIAHSRRVAHDRVENAKAQITSLPSSPAQSMLLVMADAVISRST